MKTAILTGASSGLGKELAMCIPHYFPDVCEIWLVARRAERLNDLAASINSEHAHITAIPVCMDVTAADFTERFSDILSEKQPDVALLINCAGVGYLGSFDTSVLSEQMAMVNVNVAAPTALTHMCLPYMKNGARIINIASIAGFAPNPRLSVYSATKHYVKALSFALCHELHDRNISVTAVCPGPMATEFVDVGRISGRSKTFESLPYTDPHKAATAALKASLKRKRIVTPGIFFKFMRVLCKLVPSRLMVYFTRV